MILPAATMASLAVRRMVASWSSAVSSRTFSTSLAAAKGHGVGIVAMETYMSSRFVAQEALEKADGVSAGKYTVGASPAGRRHWRAGRALLRANRRPAT